jgi:hypothetical protein
MTYLLTGILLYLLYRFITGFVWPVYKATGQVKKQFDAMKTQMNREENFDEGFSRSQGSFDDKPKFDPGGEYIPFEEIKEK